VVTLGFLATIGVGTLLLLLPISSTGRGASFVEALFTATSATCVTGLAVVDTEVFWTPFGQAVILALIQIGGFGVMSVAALLGLVLTRRLGLSSRLVAAEATHSVSLGDVKRILLGTLWITLVAEGVLALVLAVRLVVGYGESAGHALWSGVFHSVSSFNNAGFSIYSDSLMRFVGDPWICLPICFAVIVGGLGFPVMLELWRHARTRRDKDRPHPLRTFSRWSIHTRLTVATTGILLAAGTLFVLTVEWANPRTMGPLDVPGKVLASFTHSVMTRTAGFNSVDTSEMNHGTWFLSDVLMFIGGGSAGTAGGVKVGTFAILAFIIWSELRGDSDVTVFDRRIVPSTLRQALTVALGGVALVIVSTLAITVTVPPEVIPLDRILFEVVSAFSTTGLSTGITADLEGWHQVLLVVLMFLGRLGPITLGTGLALRQRARVIRQPEGAVIIG
jgi:trk system potassium uptake protein TrkH